MEGEIVPKGVVTVVLFCELKMCFTAASLIPIVWYILETLRIHISLGHCLVAFTVL